MLDLFKKTIASIQSRTASAKSQGVVSETAEESADSSTHPAAQKNGTIAKDNRPRPSVAHRLSGEDASFVRDLKPYLPSELVGGAVPYVPGTEEEAVWNAASQACATEKVHYVYSIEENKVWYLACPSTALASSPDSWLPLAAALPGNSEYWDRETVYLYEQEGLASALRWDPETGRMQIYLGAGRTILPRIQSMDANFVTINPQMAQIVPWRNRQLKTEILSRATARMLLVTGVVLNFLILAGTAMQYIMVNAIDRNLQQVRLQTDQASTDIMMKAAQAMQNEPIRHMVRVQQLLDELAKIDGTLVRYQFKSGALEWEALVPAAYASGVMSIRGQAQPGIEKDGRIRIKGNQ